MKKITFFKALSFLTITLVFATGCAKKNTESVSKTADDKKVTIKFSNWDSFDKNIIKDFEKENPNIKVEHVNIPDSDYSQKINTMLIGGNAPDVMLQFETDLPRYAKSGSILNLEKYINKTPSIKNAKFISAVNDLNKDVKGEYGLPWCYGAEVLFYNKDMFDKAGVKYPTNDWTWEDFESAAKKLTIRNGDSVSQWGTDSLTFRGGWWSMAGQAGDKVATSNDKLKVGSGLEKALKFQNRLTNIDKVSPQPSTGENVADLFGAGKAAMTRTGNWMIPQYKDAKFKWDIAPLPKDEQQYTTLHTGFYTINAKSKNPDAAWKFISYMMSKKGQRWTNKHYNNVSAIDEYAKKQWFKSPGANGPTNWDVLNDAGNYGKFGYVLLNAQTTTDMVNQFDSYLLGKTTIDNIMKKQVPKANTSLKKNTD
ncbi:ABC transporter substrate-binding protein [Lapidilactobacillus bayanensis]|uniref:ABC transporter substrate-binding protein n=1 Tax=Lapidilactobacillus bayanensis TaxID=2485998 RepID=UPI001CDC0069|nr:sugar ABC transporter substrate-binding protein [Lapidilactobacillus bayanensis]